jgi:hypothetical protein
VLIPNLRRVSAERRSEMEAQARSMLAESRPEGEVLERLRKMGAGRSDAAAILEAAGKDYAASQREFASRLQSEAEPLDDEALEAVDLPEIAFRPANFYFAVGVTPQATSDDIRHAYRAKLRFERDRLTPEFTDAQWREIRSYLDEAAWVLLDPDMRRAYDVFWRKRSRETALRLARDGERRGDWTTRSLWDMADVSSVEERLTQFLTTTGDLITSGLAPAQVVGQFAEITHGYDLRASELKQASEALDDAHRDLRSRLKYELMRKDPLISTAEELAGWLEASHGSAGGGQKADVVQEMTSLAAELRKAHHAFDMRMLLALAAE